MRDLRILAEVIPLMFLDLLPYVVVLLLMIVSIRGQDWQIERVQREAREQVNHIDRLIRLLGALFARR